MSWVMEQVTRNLTLDWQDALGEVVMEAVFDCGGATYCDACPDLRHGEHPGRGKKIS